MKRVLSAAALVLAGATLTACGGAPTDASESDFCDAMTSAGQSIVEQGEKDGDEKVDFGDAIDELESTGTPEGISDDAREGFESVLDAMKELDGKTVDEVNDESDDLDGDDEFGDYYLETCSGA
ncbi:hypothetical protein QE364_003132 [Nocardioides zeae]|uniref:Uncharacterized protein n=2 Tax=Nocardioides zeae TaxID=1457234 RepID=A0ACC6IL96_9ACTN|nr:hypothetical protein [Nocardioides zeae]MDQ1106277.1 hypothetical protein [Nocardioides zeae]MDR6174037.1 hypothetical protein [Nocardioides zeae]MDR6211408.1 hypothetical protein [Nocardioides zeae]